MNFIFIVPENQETNENWDEKQLAEAAEKKHGEKDRKRPNQTDIVIIYLTHSYINLAENFRFANILSRR